MSQEILTTEEKLDYIYSYVRKEQKKNLTKSIFKWILRILFIGYILYSYFYLLPELKKNFLEPILKPLWIKELSIWEIKDFINSFSSMTSAVNLWDSSQNTTNNDTNTTTIWNTWLKIDKAKLDKIKELLNQ